MAIEANGSSLTNSWQPPAEEVIKLYCDASSLQSSGGAGLGFVARDWKGEVLGARHVEYMNRFCLLKLYFGQSKWLIWRST